MEPSREHPQRSDSQTPLPRFRPDVFTGPVQRRPPLSRGSAQLPRARQPVAPPQPSPPPPPEPVASKPPVGYQQPTLAAAPIEAAEPEPIIQMPQPESLAPSFASTQQQDLPAHNAEQQSSEQPEAVQTPTPVNHPGILGHRLDFTPPTMQNRRRWMYPALAAVAVLILGAGVFSYSKVQAARNNPDNVMRNALNSTLSLNTLQGTTKSLNTIITTKYDFSNGKNPTTSSDGQVNTLKGQARITGYGDLKDTYVNYASLPKVVPSKISDQTSNTWTQVRQNGELPKNVPDIVFKASDPRYQAFGPIIMGNFESKTKEQLLDFIIKNKVYGYDIAKVKKDKLGDETVFVYPIKLDVSFLKVASQSAAVNIGLEPTEVRLATDAMESLRDAKVTMYIRASDNTFARMYISKDGTTKTIDLSGYRDTKLPGAPQTKLLWQGFTPLQNQIESLTSLTKAQY